MTNKEKFIEVFGEELQRQYATKSWWEQEYVPPMSYTILFNNGTTINIDATDAIFHEAIDYETFVKEDSVGNRTLVARINLNNVAGWISTPVINKVESGEDDK